MSDKRTAEQVMADLDFIRQEEGTSILIFCDKPDFGPGANSAVEVDDYFLGWNCRRFEGDSFAEAVHKARVTTESARGNNCRGGLKK
jgi:hypothetical protein